MRLLIKNHCNINIINRDGNSLLQHSFRLRNVFIEENDLELQYSYEQFMIYLIRHDIEIHNQDVVSIVILILLYVY